MTFHTRVLLLTVNNINKLNTRFSQLQEKDKLPYLASRTGKNNRHRKRHTSQSLYPFCCQISLSRSPQNHGCFRVQPQSWALRAASHREKIWHCIKNLERLNMSFILIARSQFLIHSSLRKPALPIPPKEPFKISLLSMMGFTELFTSPQLPKVLAVHTTRTVVGSKLLLQGCQWRCQSTADVPADAGQHWHLPLQPSGGLKRPRATQGQTSWLLTSERPPPGDRQPGGVTLRGHLVLPFSSPWLLQPCLAALQFTARSQGFIFFFQATVTLIVIIQSSAIQFVLVPLIIIPKQKGQRFSD